MDVPGIVSERLADESRLTSVSIGNDDRVYVTPSRTLVYHSAGLFSSESVEEYPHDAIRFDISASRREASFAFEYDDGVRGFAIPSDRIETVLPPVIAGVLRSTGLIDDDESIAESYRFGDRTLVVTDRRLLTSVGEAVWDRDYESYAFADVTDVAFEAGTLLIAIGGQRRRLDLSGEGDREAYQTVEDALLAYHNVDTVEEIGSQDTDEFRPRTTSNDDGGTPDQQTTSHQQTTSPETADQQSSNPDTPKQPRTRSPNTDVQEAETDTSTEQSPSRPHTTAQPSDAAGQPSENVGQPSDDIRSSGEDAQSSDTSGRSMETQPGASASSTEPTVAIEDTETARTTAPTASDAARRDADSSAAAEIVDEIDALREAVDRQTELLERQQATLERLADRLDDER
ncbi:DUF7115 domain-containing protein [Halococcus saccharolyticus]|uniref:DUF7115 domain-containing protein n=1 Tax=Halococcus saccharolyticus DSM 5350 TaxID=1227455 RepID=M0MCE6_9EURY|nr:hypothetical protein [Halococcus saccharolyticus]EMA43421.1 hypothetical protein C449_15642 [Halococcus saccharolyticus DSM 5350]